VVRAESKEAAVKIERYEFKTRRVAEPPAFAISVLS
jgi:hypothetical protein